MTVVPFPRADQWVARVTGAADGGRTPHDGRWVVAWDPHTPYGELALTSTADRAEARRFRLQELLTEQRAVSRVQHLRPDGELNRPLTGVHLEVTQL